MIRELPPALAKIAKKELNEDPKRLTEDIQHLKDWISKQPHLRARTDDQWLVALLRGCKFSLETVKKKFDLYYTLKSTAPDITLSFKPTEQKFIDFIKKGRCLILKKSQDLSIPRVILIRAGAFDPQTEHINEILCVLYYLVQILVVEDDVSTVVGTKVLVDFQGVNMNHVGQATPTFIKKAITILQDSMPLRLKGSHFINVPPSLDFVFSMVRGLIKEKSKQRMKIHKTHEDLMEHIPKEIIAAEYGGEGGSFTELSVYWANKMIEYRSWMQMEETLGTDESKRPGKPKTAEDLFGVEGSFRKLDID